MADQQQLTGKRLASQVLLPTCGALRTGLQSSLCPEISQEAVARESQWGPGARELCEAVPCHHALCGSSASGVGENVVGELQQAGEGC